MMDTPRPSATVGNQSGTVALVIVVAVCVATGVVGGALTGGSRGVSASTTSERVEWTAGPTLRHPESAIGVHFGSLITIGDVNDDGAPDVVIGAPGAAVGGQNAAGEAFVFLGPDFVRILSLVDPMPAAGARFGAAAAVADIDGDSIADIVVGAAGAEGDPGRNVDAVPGAVLIFQGPAFTSVQRIDPPPGVGAPGFGGALTVSDITDNDALDLIVGDTKPYRSPDIGLTPDRTVLPEEGVRIFAGPELEPGPLLRSASRSVYGACSVWECSYFGATVAVADLDADGQSDLLVGEWHSIDTTAARGSVYVFRAPSLTLEARVPGMLTRQFVNLFGSAIATGDLRWRRRRRSCWRRSGDP